MFERRADIKFQKNGNIKCSGREGGQSEADAYLRLKKMREAGGSRAWKEDLISGVWGESAKSTVGC